MLLGRSPPHTRAIVGAHESGITVCQPVRSKKAEDLLQGIQKMLLVLEQHYALPIISRIHSDEDPGIQKDDHNAKTLTGRAIRLTSCKDFGSARAELAIGKLSGKVRTMLEEVDLADSIIPLVWPCAMTYAAHREALTKIKDDAPAASRAIPRFLQTALVPTGNTSRAGERYCRAVYLCPAPNSTMGHYVMPLRAEGLGVPAIKDVVTVDMIKPIIKSDGTAHFTKGVKIARGTSKMKPLRQNKIIVDNTDLHHECSRCARSPSGVCVRHRAQAVDAHYGEFLNHVEDLTACSFLAGMEMSKHLKVHVCQAKDLKEQYDKHVEKCDADSGTIQELLEEAEAYLLSEGHDPMALVTELYEGPETIESKQAMVEEIGKMREFGVFDMEPVDLKELRKRNDDEIRKARVVGVKGIMSIKNVEEAEDKREWKGRLVATGNHVRDVYLHKAPDFSMWSPTSSMQALRFVCAQSVVKDQKLESVDLRSAYLQAPLLPEEGEWYPILDNTAVSGLTDKEKHLRREIEEKGGISVHRLRTSLYGRTKSGATLVKSFLSFLRRSGVVVSDFDQALWVRKIKGTELWIAVYVDDMIATGTAEDLKAFWTEVRAVYSVKESSAGETKKFIGVEFARLLDHQEFRRVELSLRDYTKRIVARYLQSFGGAVRCKNTPATMNLFGDAFEVKSKDNDVDEDRKTYTPNKEELKFLQQTIGELLWLTRTIRMDIGYATVQLASRILKWSAVCHRQLRHLMGFLMSTWDAAVVIKAHKDET